MSTKRSGRDTPSSVSEVADDEPLWASEPTKPMMRITFIAAVLAIGAFADPTDADTNDAWCFM